MKTNLTRLDYLMRRLRQLDDIGLAHPFNGQMGVNDIKLKFNFLFFDSLSHSEELYLKFNYDEGQLSLFLLNHLFCLVMFFDKTNHFLSLNLIKLMEHYFFLKKSNLHKSFLLNGNYVFHQNLRS